VVAALTATLAGPDDALERTAALLRPPRRAAHLLMALAVVAAPLLATLVTGARFGPVWLVIRDADRAAGGLIAYATAGPARRAPAEAGL
jgi:hypothetical protein